MFVSGPVASTTGKFETRNFLSFVLAAGLLVSGFHKHYIIVIVGAAVPGEGGSTGSEPLTAPSTPPNIVIVLTDDLDWTLGGANASTLSRTRHWIGSRGKIFSNWFVQTPVCCPSRAELLTGKVYHNLRVPNGTSEPEGCMHIDVKATSSHPFYRRDYFARFFSESSVLASNYTVGIFGKHLNTHNPHDFVPRGVDEMLINGGGEYLNPTFTNGKRRGDGDDDFIVHDVTFDNCIELTGMSCYSTSIIGNASLSWIRRQVHPTHGDQPSSKANIRNGRNHRQSQTNPFFALISVKAPHLLDGPDFAVAIPAPWYENTTIPERYAPRTPNYNFSGSVPPYRHHWLVRTQPPITALQAKKVDELYVSRLKSLISVDDMVVDLVRTLEDLHVLHNTYIVFTSDNGYRLGQFRMPSCKLHPYENDVRVPMMIRGPGIRPGGTSDVLSTHVNLMPTLLGLATNRRHEQDETVVPDTMDGTNLAWVVVDTESDSEDHKDHSVMVMNDTITTTTMGPYDENSLLLPSSTTPYLIHKPNSILIEYISLGDVVRYQHLVDTFNHTFLALRMIHPFGEHDDDVDQHDGTLPIRNLKYIEFRDSRDDWDCLYPALERELYDLDKDPYEMENLIDNDVQLDAIPPEFLQLLHNKMQRMFRCKGEACRWESMTGLNDVMKYEASGIKVVSW